MGGCGLTRPRPGRPTLFEYAVGQQTKSSPAVGFLHQASAENAEYAEFFEESCAEIGAVPTVFSLFGRVDINAIHRKILAQDVMFVGGGNLKTMLAIWREWGIDRSLRQAYDQGCIISGVSAGALCWYAQCVSDAFGPLTTIEGLGWLEGSLCPHFDSEPTRRPITLALRESGAIDDGWALDDYTAIHLVDEELKYAVKSKRGHFVYRVDGDGATRVPIQSATELLARKK